MNNCFKIENIAYDCATGGAERRLPSPQADPLGLAPQRPARSKHAKMTYRQQQTKYDNKFHATGHILYQHENDMIKTSANSDASSIS